MTCRRPLCPCRPWRGLAQIKHLLAQEKARLVALAAKSDVPHAVARVENAAREAAHHLGVMETAAGAVAPASEAGHA